MKPRVWKSTMDDAKPWRVVSSHGIDIFWAYAEAIAFAISLDFDPRR